MRFPIRFAGICIAVASLLWHCATQVPPSGGPEDKTPPRVIHVKPESKSTNVPRDQTIEFEFSESIDHRSLEKALFISPDPGEAVKYDWKGRRLLIRHEDSLRVNRTYVITLGTDLQDLRRNSLTQSYTLAFSTGQEISDGRIQGRVYASQALQGVLIWAYILEADQEPDPSEDVPDYVTQTGADGSFELTNLSEGRYRLFAIKDQDSNRFYEPGLDGIGVSSEAVLSLSGDSLLYSGLNFKIRTTDNVGPAMVSVAARHQTRIGITFDEALAATGIDETGNYRIQTSKQPDSLTVVRAYPDPADPGSIVLLTEKQTAGEDYTLTVTGITDVSGNVVDPEFNSLDFAGGAAADTLGPAILATVPQDSARAVPLNSPVEIKFNEPVAPLPFERNFLIADTAAVPGSMIWLTPAWAKFTPDRPLKSATQYRVSVRTDSLLDLAGNASADSALNFILTTLDSDTLASVSGTISDPDSTAVGPIIMSARQTKANDLSYTIHLEAPGPYLFDKILPGSYIIEGYRDRNGDGQYDYGSPVPYAVAERFFVYGDSVKVRSGWPNEGNDISFNK